MGAWLLFFVFCIPAVIAWIRNHSNRTAITILSIVNAFLLEVSGIVGLFIGIILLLWSVIGRKHQSQQTTILNSADPNSKKKSIKPKIESKDSPENNKASQKILGFLWGSICVFFILSIIIINYRNEPQNKDTKNNSTITDTSNISGRFFISIKENEIFIHNCYECKYAKKDKHVMFDKEIDDFESLFYSKHSFCICVSDEEEQIFRTLAINQQKENYYTKEEPIDISHSNKVDLNEKLRVGSWKINLNANGFDYGTDYLTLYFNEKTQQFRLNSSTNVPNPDDVTISKIEIGWIIKYKKKWDDHYILTKEGKLVMKNPKYPDASSNCIGSFKVDVLSVIK